MPSRNGVSAWEIVYAHNAREARAALTRYGVEEFVKDCGRLVHSDEYGNLWFVSAGPDEPIRMVEVVNSTPEPDGTRTRYWLRVPPTVSSAHEGVAWTFGRGRATYAPAVQT